MKLGANDVIAYPLPPMGRTLGKAVEKIFKELLPGFDKNMLNCQPRQLKGGIINLTKEGVEICGILICDYQENGEAGRLFEILAEVNCYGRRIRLSAQKLAKIFGISQQAVFTMLKRLRKKIRDELLKFGILCDPQSIIPNQDGYHISDNFEICDKRKNSKKKAKPPTDNMLFEYPEITDRRELWIVEQCCRGVKLQRIDVDKKFNQSAVTSSRLLAKLRQEGIIEFVGNGSQGYWRMVDSQRAIKCPVVLQS
jgi:transposase